MGHNLSSSVASSTLSSPLPAGERIKVRGIKKELFFRATLTLTLSLAGRGKYSAPRRGKETLSLLSWDGWVPPHPYNPSLFLFTLALFAFSPFPFCPLSSVFAQ